MRYLKCSSKKTTTNLEFYTKKTIFQKWKGNEGLVWSTRNTHGSSQAEGARHRSETWIHIMKGSVSPDQGWSPCRVQWEHRALPSRLPEKSPDLFFFLFLVHLKKKYLKIITGNNWLDGCESEWTLGVGDGQGGLACCDSWGRKESDTTERLNWTEYWLCTRLTCS